MSEWRRALRVWMRPAVALLVGAAGIACSNDTTSTRGRIEVAVESIGVPEEVDGYQVVITGDLAPVIDPTPIDPNGTILVDDLDPGVYLVTLTGVPQGCQGADPGDPRAATLSENGFARVEFLVSCSLPES